jgi:hypothetical protein
MRVLSVFIICGFMALPSTVLSTTLPEPRSTTIYPAEDVYKKPASLMIKEVQKLIGRKLTLKEKISFLVLKHTYRKPAQTKKGNTAFIFGLVGLGLLMIGLFVSICNSRFDCRSYCRYYFRIKRKRLNPSDGKARAAVLMGWITIGRLHYF